MSEEVISKQAIRRDVLSMSGPILVEVLMGTLFGMVDMIMLGHYGTKDISLPGIGAVGITNQFIFIGLALVQALNTGGTTMVARYIGARKTDRIESVVRHIIILTQLMLVLPLLLIGLSNTSSVMKFLGGRQDMILIGSDYFRVILLGFIFQAFNFSVFASLRGAGDTRTPMRINLGVNLLNVFGNAVLIFGLLGFPELGVTGAAISTSFAHLVASIILGIILLSKHSLISIDLRKRFKFDKNILYNLIKIGVPASLEQIAMRVGLILFTRVVSGLGTVSYATHQICIQILNLSLTPGQAFGVAASTLTGRSLGADRPDLAELYIKHARRYGSIFAIIMAVVFFFFGGEIASLFNKNPEVISSAGNVLKLMAFIQPFQCSQLVITGGLRGAGDTVWTLIATFITILIIRNIMARIFINIFFMGLVGAWLGVLIDQAIRWGLILLRFKSGKWKYIEIR